MVFEVILALGNVKARFRDRDGGRSRVAIELESLCCKKSPNQEIGLRRFSEYRTSEGSE